VGLQTREGKNTPPAVAHGSLLVSRLMIRCPATGRATDTAFDVTDLPRLGSGSHWILDCMECGRDHEWQVDDVIVE
jgi:hypothetical protein